MFNTATSFCPFCNADVPAGHVSTCPKCLGQLHMCNGIQTCACCGTVTDRTPVVEPVKKVAKKKDAEQIVAPVLEPLAAPVAEVVVDPTPEVAPVAFNPSDPQ